MVGLLEVYVIREFEVVERDDGKNGEVLERINVVSGEILVRIGNSIGEWEVWVGILWMFGRRVG